MLRRTRPRSKPRPLHSVPHPFQCKYNGHYTLNTGYILEPELPNLFQIHQQGMLYVVEKCVCDIYTFILKAMFYHIGKLLVERFCLSHVMLGCAPASYGINV